MSSKGILTPITKNVAAISILNLRAKCCVRLCVDVIRFNVGVKQLGVFSTFAVKSVHFLSTFYRLTVNK